MSGSRCKKRRDKLAPHFRRNRAREAGSSAAVTILLAATLLGSALAGRAQVPPQLPDGNGKEAVQKACGSCHALSTVTNAGHNREGWTSVVHMMVNAGAPVPKDQIAAVTDYLAKNFPEKPAPEAVVIPGSVAVSIKEWQVPTPGSRPHDPAYAPDGSVWYTGQMANVSGTVRSQDAAVQGIPFEDSGFRAAWACAG